MSFKQTMQKVKPYVWGLIVVLVATILMGVFTLGSTKSPDSYWQTNFVMANKPATAVIEFVPEKDGDEQPVGLNQIWLNLGAIDSEVDQSIKIKFWYGSTSSSQIYSASLGEVELQNLTVNGKEGNPNLYRWVLAKDKIELNQNYTFVKITVEGDIVINEISFVDKNGKQMQLKVHKADTVETGKTDEKGEAITKPVKHNQDCLIDEQGSFNVKNSRKNLLSGREAIAVSSAWNILNGKGYVIDEIVPPLGQMLTAVGVAIFGTNTLGARFIPFLFGLATIAVLFAFGKKLFKNGWYGVLLSALFVLSGLGLGMMITSSTAIIFTFFIVLAFYFIYEFYCYGIDYSHKFASVTPLILTGIFFAFAFMTDLRAVYALPGLVAVFAFTLVRQYRAYKIRQQNDEQNADVQTAVYKNKLLLSVGSFVGALALGMFIVTVLVYGIVIKPYGLYYGETSLFGVIGASLGGMLNRATAIGDAAGSATNAFGWLINAKAQPVFLSTAADGYTNTAYVFSNLFTLVLALVSFLYLTATVIATAVNRKKISEVKKVAFGEILRPYLTLVCGFASIIVLSAVTKASPVANFLPASVFYLGFIVLAAKTLIGDCKKTVFTVKGFTVTAGKLATYVLIALAVVFFALMFSGLAGCTLADKTAKGLYLWFVRG